MNADGSDQPSLRARGSQGRRSSWSTDASQLVYAFDDDVYSIVVDGDVPRLLQLVGLTPTPHGDPD